jgi:type I restriction enzyme, S subunit
VIESVRLKWLLDEVDDRAGERAATLPLLSVSITRGVQRRDASDTTTRAAAEDLSNYKLSCSGDLVINRMRAFQGALGIAPEDGVVSPDYSVLRISPLIDRRWLNYYLTSTSTVSEMASLVRGIGGTEAGNVRTPRLNVSDLQSMRVNLESLGGQRAIADYLDRETARIDMLLEEQQRLIKVLQERRAAVIESEVASAQTTSTGQRLKHVVVEVKQGWSPQCYPWPADGVTRWAVLKAGAANGGVFRADENKELPETEVPRPDTAVERGQLVISRANTRELAGSAAVVNGDYPRLMLSDKLYGFTLDPNRAVPSYVASVLGTRHWRGLIELCASGSSPSMQNISQSDILNLPMDLPDVTTQQNIVGSLRERTAKIDALIVETERFVELSRERCSALITAAVTGQIDVRDEVA